MSAGSGKRGGELYAEAAKNGFSKNDVDQLMKFSKIMSSKIMKKFLLDSVDEAAGANGLAAYERAKDVPAEKTELYATWKRLRANIGKIKVEEFVGYQEMSFEEGSDKYTLRMQLSIVPKNYALEIRLPERMVREFFTHLDNLIRVAMQYYHVEAEKIIKDLAAMFPDDDISSLGINKQNRTLCLSEAGNVRIGVLCFFIGADGKPLTIS